MHRYILKSLLALTFLAPSSMYADDVAFLITTASGETYTYLFSEEPEIVPEGNVITITSNDPSRQPMTFTFDDLSDITPTVVKNITVTDTPTFQLTNNSLILKSAKEVVRVYDTSGQLVSSATPDSDGSVTIPLSSLPSSTYIVKTGTLTMKIRK